jgi:hypothetical protein
VGYLIIEKLHMEGSRREKVSPFILSERMKGGKPTV